jgi:hypothetical protein
MPDRGTVAIGVSVAELRKPAGRSPLLLLAGAPAKGTPALPAGTLCEKAAD